jgi:polysaccharide export outer membrane protein
MKQIPKIRFLVFFASIFFLSSCITNRNLEYINTEHTKVQSANYEYVIQKEDLLSVQISSTTKSEYDFFNLQETSNPQLMAHNPYLYGYLVKTDGMVILPMIGSVKVEGFTISEVEDEIKKISSTYFKDPIVKVNILNFQVSILGEVHSPGEYNIVRSNQNIFHLIGKSQDLTEFANRKRVKVIRKNGVESTRVIFLDLTDPKLLNNKNIYLQPQDIVYVEPLNDFYAGFKSMSSVISLGISSITLYLLLTNR